MKTVSATCTADLVPDVRKESELKAKGTAFLRCHATKHGVVNASRKKLDFFVRELSTHYLSAHNVCLVQDLVLASSESPGSGRSRPVIIDRRSMPQDQRALNSTTFNIAHCQNKNTFPPRLEGTKKKRSSKVQPSDQPAPTECHTPIIAQTREELNKISTGVLRPHASRHKILNSSRRTKQNVIQELWHHYETFHSQAIVDGTAAPTVNMCLPAATAQAVTIPPPVSTHQTALTMSELTYVAKFCNPDPLCSPPASSLPLDVPTKT